MLGLRFVLVAPAQAAKVESGELEWLWDAANRRELPVGVIVGPKQMPLLGEIAAKYPRMRLLVDHLSVGPFTKLPQAQTDIEALISLAKHPNIAAKATGVPSMANDPYPFQSTHDVLRKTFTAFGPDRFFWGTDITRMQCSWRQCADMFLEELPWLKGNDLERVMGSGVSNWIGWK